MNGPLIIFLSDYYLIFSGAILKGCNMEDPTGSRAVMEGVNLKG